MSLAKLTSLSTQTLSLLLERQRLHTITSTSNLHLPQITRNLQQLRTGILSFEKKEGSSEAARLLRNQYERMRDMLGEEAELAGVQSLAADITPSTKAPVSPHSPLPRSPSPLPQLPPQPKEVNGSFAPYTDDPEAGPSTEPTLQVQREMMDQQDVHLDRLSSSINRQRDLSLQINDELDVHTGLLEDLDVELDQTSSRLSGARRRLDRVAKGAKENGSTVMIGLLILILLILIIVFKT